MDLLDQNKERDVFLRVIQRIEERRIVSDQICVSCVEGVEEIELRGVP